MRFLLNVLATLVGLFLFFGLLFLLLLSIGIAASTADDIRPISENTVLRLDLNRPIEERTIDDPLSQIPGFTLADAPVGLLELKQAIKAAGEDEKIKGIYLNAGLISAGYATIEEIRNALIDFKASGKFVIAYSEIFTEAGYYLASVAHEIYLTPDYGLFELNGLSASTTFFKGTLDKLEIEPQIFRVGEFKSAIEPFTRKDMSEESRLQTASYVNSIYDTYLENISAARNIPVDELRIISDSMRVQLPEDAVAYQLITQLSHYDEVLTNIREKIGVEEEEKINFVSLNRYRKSLKTDKDGYSENRVAVIIASGIIAGGEGDDSMIGSEKYAKEIRKARLDDKVKAVVLRINSGGGGALASDVIRREVALTAEVKPIIASMSDIAASGGYAIAMSCDTIVAHPNTLTGSIGVFLLSFNLQKFLDSKLGITVDRVNTGAFSDILSQAKAATEQERQIIQRIVDDSYEQFITQAAQDRNIPLEEMKKIAEGRVWSGIDAKKANLVDVLGGMEDAIDIAVKSAGIEEDYRIRYYPEQKTWIEKLLSSLESDIEVRTLKQQLGEFYPYVHHLKELQQMQGVQARLPFEIVIE